MLDLTKYNNAVSYSRYSSKMQNETSISGQQAAIGNFALNNGINIVGQYADRAVSAKSDKRPSFQKMMRDIRNAKYPDLDSILVWKNDRFARNMMTSIQFKAELRKLGVRVISINELTGDSPQDIFIEHIFESSAELFSNNLAEDSKRGQMEIAKLGMFTGGVPCLGFRINDEKKYEIEPSEAVIIQEIFEMYSIGHTYGEIIKVMNQKEYKTKRGNPFGKNSLHEILCNEKYTGMYIFNRRPNGERRKNDDGLIRNPGMIPQIVEQNTFDKVRKIMADKKRNSGAKSSKTTYLLTGKIKCGECGSSMNGAFMQDKRRDTAVVAYRCGKKERGLDCHNKQISRDEIESLVIAQLKDKIFNPRNIPLILKSVNEYKAKHENKNGADMKLYKKRLKIIDDGINNLMKAIEGGTISPTITQKLNTLEKDKAEIEQKIDVLSKIPVEEISEEALMNAIDKFSEILHQKDPKILKYFVDQYLDEVIVYKDKVSVAFKATGTFSFENMWYYVNINISREKLRSHQLYYIPIQNYGIRITDD